jgi:hypothetical protein
VKHKNLIDFLFFKTEAIFRCAFQVTYDPFDCCQVTALGRFIHRIATLGLLQMECLAWSKA